MPFWPDYLNFWTNVFSKENKVLSSCGVGATAVIVFSSKLKGQQFGSRSRGSVTRFGEKLKSL